MLYNVEFQTYDMIHIHYVLEIDLEIYRETQMKNATTYSSNSLHMQKKK